jgi:hypothetical protein
MLAIRHVAFDEGWQIFDLARSLLAFGALMSFLSLERPKNLERLREIAVLGETTGALDSTVAGKPKRRRYSAIRCGGSTEVIRLPMPVEYTRMVESYAAMADISPNQAYVKFLELGLIAYLKAKKTLTEAILLTGKQKAKLATRTAG